MSDLTPAKDALVYPLILLAILGAVFALVLFAFSVVSESDAVRVKACEAAGGRYLVREQLCVQEVNP